MDLRSKHLRRLIVEALEGGGRGHIGASLSLVEILRVLYDSYLSFNAPNPYWPQRDRLILSKGHGCLALYAILADKKFFAESELKTFCRPTSRLGGHPELKRSRELRPQQVLLAMDFRSALEWPWRRKFATIGTELWL